MSKTKIKRRKNNNNKENRAYPKIEASMNLLPGLYSIHEVFISTLCPQKIKKISMAAMNEEMNKK